MADPAAASGNGDSQGLLRRAWQYFWYSDGLVAWFRSAMIAVLLTLLLRWPLVEPFSIPSGSMEPTFHGDPRFLMGDRVFVNKWVYGVRIPFANERIWRGRDPERWDIVVFRSVENDPDHKILVKRVVGLPGERIQIANGLVYADGEPLEVPDEVGDIEYTSYGRYGVAPGEEYSVVPPDHYLVLGDNSAHSRDGRIFGWLPNDHILGRVTCIWWPIPRARDFTGFTETLWWRGGLTLLAAFLFWRLCIGRSWRVQGRELGERFAPKAHLYINRLAYGVPVPMTRKRLTQGREPVRGEIVSYYARINRDVVVLAGRVAGLPGEKISLENGRVYINGEQLTAPATLAEPRYASTDGEARGDAWPTTQIPAGGYFLLTEDTESLPDSRTFGAIAKVDIIGPATAAWWPPAKWGSVDP